MKNLILSIAFALPLVSFAQLSEEQLWENANYEVVRNGASVFYTDVNATQTPYTDKDFNRIKAKMFQKEGIVRVDFLKENRTIRVYHFDYVDLETVKSFVLREKTDIEVANRVAYDMH